MSVCMYLVASPKQLASRARRTQKSPMQKCRFPLGVWAGFFCGVVLCSGERVTQGKLVTENVPPISPELAERTNQYQNIRSARLQAWFPGNKGVLISTRFGNSVQLHHVARPGGDRRQLTFYNEPVSSASFSPDPTYSGILFRRDVGGSEFFQLYWFDLKTGKSALLTDGKSRNGGAVWSNKGDRFVHTSTRRNGKDNDLYLVSMQAPTTAKKVVDLSGAWSPLDWSPDDRELILFQGISANESYLHRLDLETGRLTPINPRTGGSDTIAYQGAAWSADKKRLFLVSDENAEFQQLRELDLATGRQKVLTGDIAWDVESLTISRDRSRLAFTVNDNGRSRLYLYDIASGKRSAIPDLPLGGVYGMEFSPDGRQLGFSLTTSQTPGDVYVLTLATGAIERWTESEVGGLDPATFTVPSLIAYPTFDDVALGKKRQIPAIYYRPSQPAVGGKYPVVINIHGGPESQSTISFVPTTQFMVNELGVAVIFPNVRGSSGYGKSYLKLDNGMKREDSVKDIGALLDWIEAQPELDSKRVMVMGGSYGGYMVLASMTHYNDRLAGGIDNVGISNFVTFLTNTQDYRRDLRRVEYGDERDPEMRAFLERISPLTNVKAITKPMFIAQGYNDPRVPVTEAEQIVAALKANGVKPWYMLAMDEGHGFAKKENANAYQNAIMAFLEQQFFAK